MRRTNRALHHHPAQLRPAARALTALAAALLAALPGAALGQGGETVELPTPLDAIAVVPGAQDILLGAGFEEVLFPGRVVDDELVEVDLDTDGAPAAVRVTQRLELTGVGDFSFRIPGPASAVEPLPDSGSQPGLRRGSVIWQGFSPGRRLLAARMHLSPEAEAGRLPLRFELSITVGGEPLLPGRRLSGPFTLRLRVTNATPFPTPVEDAEADPAAAAAALDAIRAELRAGRRPVPGRAGVPPEIPVEAPSERRITPIEAAMALTGRIVLPAGSVGELNGRGVRISADGTTARFARRLGGGRPLTTEIRIDGLAQDLELPRLEVRARPVPPLASTVEPPTGAGSWSAAADPDGRALLARAMDTMWRVARLRLFDAYLGSPDPSAPARSRFVYRLAPPRAAPPPPVVVPRTLGTFGAALAGVAALTLLFSAGLLWANA